MSVVVSDSARDGWARVAEVVAYWVHQATRDEQGGCGALHGKLAIRKQDGAVLKEPFELASAFEIARDLEQRAADVGWVVAQQDWIVVDVDGKLFDDSCGRRVRRAVERSG